MLAGAGDNTICYFAPRVTENMGGHVSQLAKAVMFYSPWQFLFWYDRPPNSSDVIGGVPGAKGFIEKTPELDFFKRIPTVWDDSKVLEGKIGEYATLARKSGNDWFLGSLTGISAKKVEINLGFLDSSSKYETTIYSFDPKSEKQTKIKIERQTVNSDTVLQFEMEPNSGLAIHFQKN
jgi:alpha-glucosidase